MPTQVKLLELKGAQVQYIGKIACVAGSEIDREVSITHSEMLASNSRRVLDQKTNYQDLMKTEIEGLRLTKATAIPEVSFAKESKCKKELERSFEKLIQGKSVNVSDMTVTDEDGYLSRSKTFNSNNKIVKE